MSLYDYTFGDFSALITYWGWHNKY